MLLHLSDLSQEPLQGQIVRQLRAKILAGELAAEDALPSIRALARDGQVSVITVQRAYETLEREELIHSRRGKGFFVSSIDASTKSRIARERLETRLAPVLSAALAEGLDRGNIERTCAQVLKKAERSSE